MKKKYYPNQYSSHHESVRNLKSEYVYNEPTRDAVTKFLDEVSQKVFVERS